MRLFLPLRYIGIGVQITTNEVFTARKHHRHSPTGPPDLWGSTVTLTNWHGSFREFVLSFLPMSSTAPINTTIVRTGIFKSEGATALLLNLADGQTYRVTTSDGQQLRIGMEGLQQSFPELLSLAPAEAAVKVAKGALNGKDVSYMLVPSKKLDTKGKPYVNVRLVPRLENAADADIAALLGIGATAPAGHEEDWDAGF